MQNKNKVTRKLPEYLQFDIHVVQGIAGLYTELRDVDGSLLPDYRSRLTPSQWKKASVYLTRRLVPFAGYLYSPKATTTIGVYKIR